MKNKKLSVQVSMALLTVSLFAVSTQSYGQNPEQKGKHEPPNYAALLEKMDSNKDGKLSKDEVKGPLKDGFEKIDTDEDGFITEAEFEKAPKPKKGIRPQ